MNHSPSSIVRRLMRLGPRPALVVVLAASTAILAAAFAMQYLGGLEPCVLCVWQRYPYGAVIVVATLALLLGRAEPALRITLVFASAAFLIGAGIAVFNVGVERHWWPGTKGCAGVIAIPETLAELEALLRQPAPPRCDQVAWSLFGVSLAGYNALLSLALAGLSLGSAVGPKGRPEGER